VASECVCCVCVWQASVYVVCVCVWGEGGQASGGVGWSYSWRSEALYICTYVGIDVGGHFC